MAIVKNNKLFNNLNNELKEIEKLSNITKENLAKFLIEESKILDELNNVKNELEKKQLELIEEPIVSKEEQVKVSTFFEVLADCVKNKINDKAIIQEVKPEEIVLEPNEDDQEVILSYVEKNEEKPKVKCKPGRKPKK